MKSYEERLPLIDAAIKSLGGEWPEDSVAGEDVLHQFPSGRYIAGICEFTTAKVICTRDEFNQRAKELGYINGYKYGVEYETNGEKPDLPDDVLVQCRALTRHTFGHAHSTNNVAWGNVTAFRIVDERYKPKEQSMNNDWYERGELPPVGAVVEVAPLWDRVLIVAHNNGDCVFFNKVSDKYDCFRSGDYFRPIRTERDALVEKAEMDIHQKYIDVVSRHHIQTLIDAGWRPTKPMSDDEFMSKVRTMTKYEMYRAGCRFIEQVKV